MNKTDYADKWRTCHRCSLHKTAKRHAVYRGSIPADLLLVGEAPGRVENELGKPFVGPSGQLLNQMLRELNLTSYCITNLVCCIPYAPAGGFSTDEYHGVRPPTVDESGACLQHILELVELTKPRALVTVGLSAKEYLQDTPTPSGIARGHMEHPASILRHGGASSLKYKKTIYALQAFLLSAGIMRQPVLFHATPAPATVIIKG
jgi:uracil-DNA glycosylase family 4